MQSHYLGIVTLGLALAFTNWVTNAHVAGGAEGITGIPAPNCPASTCTTTTSSTTSSSSCSP
jgi:ABC-type branched-subunit amino acid transport system permease subunit